MMKSMCGGRLVEGNRKNLNSRITDCTLPGQKFGATNSVTNNANDIDSIYSYLNCIKADQTLAPIPTDPLVPIPTQAPIPKQSLVPMTTV